MTNFFGAQSRRQFLRLGSGALASAGLLSALGPWQRALAAGSDGYRALVCVWLAGGNDGFNTVVPRSDSAYRTYAASRGNLALAKNALLALNGAAADGNAYGLHGSCPELQSLFNNSGHLAILGNVGTLLRPTTAAQARNNSALPRQLFSHVDQQHAWWAGSGDPGSPYGWAGRVADLYSEQGVSARLAMNINIGGVNTWQDGNRTTPYVLGADGAPALDSTRDGAFRRGQRQQAALDLLNQAAHDANPMVAAYAGVETNAAAKLDLVNGALNRAGDLRTSFPTFPADSRLGAQLHEVARCIKAQSQLGDHRQIFFVRLDGFDTHNGQQGQQAALLQILSRNIGAFWNALGEIGQQRNVTLFTGSDFGRSLGSNGDGSDHAWGNHQFVLGGAVRGGWYGRMPNLAINGPDDVGNGRIVPTTATEQYAATLAHWFGVADSDLNTIFPNLPNFGGGAARNLGFLGGASA